MTLFRSIPLAVVLFIAFFVHGADSIAASLTETELLSNVVPSTKTNVDVPLKGSIVIEPAHLDVKVAFANNVHAVSKDSKIAVSLLSELDSNVIQTGDPVEAMLLSDIKDLNSGENLVGQGAILKGWVSDVYHSRKALSAKVSNNRWANCHAALKLHFNKLISESGRTFDISAEPAPGTPVFGTFSEFDLGVGGDGEIGLAYGGKVKNSATGIAIGAVGIAAGPLRFVLGPALSGAAGTLDPAYALDRPVADSEENARVKGFFQGMLKGLPGGSIFLGAKHQGLSIKLDKGCQLYLQLQTDLLIPKLAPVNSRSQFQANRLSDLL